jgi:hypothetical protein
VQPPGERNRRRGAVPGRLVPAGVEPAPPVSDPAAGGGPVSEFITSFDPAFRAEELSHAVSLIAHRREDRGRRATELAGAVA